VLEQHPTEARAGSFRRLYIEGVSNSGDAAPSRRYLRLQALLPLLVHPGEPRSVLVIGFGTGITAGALLAYPGLETCVVADFLPSVVRASHLFEGNFGAATDSRIDVRIGDGRHELLRRAQRYDVITLDPPPLSAAGVVNLYSRDFYALCRERLAPAGLMAQWWPLPVQNDEDSRSLVRAFLDVFPYASAWSTELHEVLLVGSLRPLEFDGQCTATRFASPEIQAALAEVGIASPAALLDTWITGRSRLEHYAGAAPRSPTTGPASSTPPGCGGARSDACYPASWRSRPRRRLGHRTHSDRGLRPSARSCATFIGPACSRWTASGAKPQPRSGTSWPETRRTRTIAG
jgi:hypothetical protein